MSLWIASGWITILIRRTAAWTIWPRRRSRRPVLNKASVLCALLEATSVHVKEFEGDWSRIRGLSGSGDYEVKWRISVQESPCFDAQCLARCVYHSFSLPGYRSRAVHRVLLQGRAKKGRRGRSLFPGGYLPGCYVGQGLLQRLCKMRKSVGILCLLETKTFPKPVHQC